MTGAVLALMACKKEGGNTAVLPQEKTQTTVNEHAVAETTYRYVAEDGSSAHVTFGEDDNGQYITIFSNNKTIRIKHSEQTADAEIYRDHDIVATSKGDTVTIEQEGNIITLKRAKGE